MSELADLTTSAEYELPSPAARARTVAGRPAATVCVAGASYFRPLAHTTTLDGRVLLVVPDRDVPATAQPGMVVVTDVCPVAVRDRVRGSVWLTGELAPVPRHDVKAAGLAFAEARPAEVLLDVGRGAVLVGLTLTDVVLSDGAGTTGVPAAAFVAARPDPFADDEASTLRHLDQSHRDILAALGRRLLGPTEGADQLRPVGLDRHGLTVRAESGPGSGRDVRLPFRPALRHVGQLAHALRALATCPGPASAT